MRNSSSLFLAGLALSGCLQVGGEEPAVETSVAGEIVARMKSSAHSAADQLAGNYGGAAAQSGAYDGRSGEPGGGVAARYYDQNLLSGGGVAARYYDQNLLPGGGVAARYYDQNLIPSGPRGE